MIGFCQYCKENKSLCNAHITPKCFYVKSSDKPFLQISENQVLKRLPVGFYDNGILCRDCDGKFSPNEEYAKRLFNDEFLQQFRSNIYKNAYVLEKNDFNYTKVRQFVLSMLWKASVSKKNECSCVHLGKYEDVCLRVLKDPTEDISDLFNILIFKFKERELKGLVFVEKARINNDIVYIFVAGGFLFYVFPSFGFNKNNKLLKDWCLNSDTMKILEVDKNFNKTHDKLLYMINKQYEYMKKLKKNNDE